MPTTIQVFQGPSLQSAIVDVGPALPVRERIGHLVESALRLRYNNLRMQKMNGCLTTVIGERATINS